MKDKFVLTQPASPKNSRNYYKRISLKQKQELKKEKASNEIIKSQEEPKASSNLINTLLTDPQLTSSNHRLNTLMTLQTI